MARRGAELREHILLTAKQVFLELGFERASMDVVATRAATSKRSVYAHFESKDKLFLAVVELVRELYSGRLGTPADYGDDTPEAVVLYCGRFLQLLLWNQVLRTCRMAVAEVDTLPEASVGYHEAFFSVPERRLAVFLAERCGLPEQAATRVTHELLGCTVYPRFIRSLFGVEHGLDDGPDGASTIADPGLATIRTAVAALLPPDVVGSPSPAF